MRPTCPPARPAWPCRPNRSTSTPGAPRIWCSKKSCAGKRAATRAPACRRKTCSGRTRCSKSISDPSDGGRARAAAEALLAHLNRLGKSAAASWPLEPPTGAGSSPREPRAASERLSLLGSVRLRAVAAVLENDAAREQVAPLLRQAVRSFAQSFRRKLRERDELERRNYALSNALLAAALLRTVERNAGQPPQTVCDTLGAVGPLDTAAAAKDAKAIVSQWISQADSLLAEVATSENCSTFWHHATAIELRTARGLFAHSQDVADYTIEEVTKDVEFVKRGIARLCALWPSPNDLDSMRHRFRLIAMIEAQFGGAEPGGMMSAVAKLADEANDRLQLRAREIG